MRLTLFARMILAFAGLAAFSLALALAMVDLSFSTDLERAAKERLARAAIVATRFLDDHCSTVLGKYAGLTHEPRYFAAAEAANEETLGEFARNLLKERGCARILFLDRKDAPIGGAGDATLDPLARGTESVELAIQGTSPVIVARVPLNTPTRPVGRLVVFERIGAGTLEWWSTACGASVVFGSASEGVGKDPEKLVTVLKSLDGVEMRIELSVRAERLALAHARQSMAVSAAAALAAAIGASLVVSRGITRPILGLKGAAHRIGGGDFSARTGVARADEIGDVARAVDEMAVHLGQSRSRLEALLDSLPFAVLLLAKDGERPIQYVNDAFERITGHLRGEATGQSPRLFVRHKEAFTAAMWEKVARGVAWTARLTDRRKDGTPYEQEATVAPVRDAAGTLLNFVAVLRDVTQEVTLEAQLRQSQKMEAMGRLAGGVAHDFNNVLTVITGYSDMLLLDLGKDDLMRPDLEEIKKAGQRAAALTQQLLAFSRKQVLQPRVLDLNASIAHMNGMLRRLIGEDVQLVISPGPSLGFVRVDPGQVEQVLMNLVVNARDAMPRGGKLTIETANADVGETGAEVRTRLRPGRYVLLTVRDTGTGMDEQTRLHLFEPFYTTKAPGKGTGLGLSTVYGIVEQSGGGIDVESVPGRGSTFRIYLPHTDDSPETPTSAPPVPARSAQGTETVLVVEDEDAVRELASRILKARGYAVLPACHGAEAIVVCERHKGPIDLLLTDMVLPHMSGGEVAERLLTLRPTMKVAFMSGFTDSQRIHRGALDPDTVFLQKPFSQEDLLRKVREALDDPE